MTNNNICMKLVVLSIGKIEKFALTGFPHGYIGERLTAQTSPQQILPQRFWIAFSSAYMSAATDFKKTRTDHADKDALYKFYSA